jgi:hypothetical protein
MILSRKRKLKEDLRTVRKLSAQIESATQRTGRAL